jgi:membrane protein required for colicin V production
MGAWNWLDSILVAVVVVSTVTAALKGFVRELISLATVLVGLTIAALGYARVAMWFEELTRSHEVALGVGFLSLFVGTLLAGAALSALARRLVKKGELERADFLLGAVFGLIRGVVVDCVLLMTLVAFALKPQAVQESRLAPYVTTGARVIALVMPRDLKDQFRSGFDKLKQAILPGDKKATKN